MPDNKLRVIFMGSPEFAVPCLRALSEACEVVLAVAQPDKPAGRGRKLTAPPVKVAAEALGIPVAQPARLRGPEGASFLQQVQALDTDLMVVAAYGKILPAGLLGATRLGPFNIHGSLLPKYRGAAPIQWSVIHGDAETGVCIMRMEEGLDTGPVVAVERTPIGPEESAGDLFNRLAAIGARLMVASLPAIAEGTLLFTVQNEALATYAPMLSKQDGRIDFSLPAAAVSARVRGVDPWPGAHAILDDNPVKLWRPRVVAARDLGEMPGRILGADDKGLLVACGTGAVLFAEMQLPGRKRLPVGAVVAGKAVAVGGLLT